MDDLMRQYYESVGREAPAPPMESVPPPEEEVQADRDVLARKALLVDLVNKSRSTIKARMSVLVGGLPDPLPFFMLFKNAAAFKEICGHYASLFSDKDSWQFDEKVFQESAIFTMEEINEALGEVTTDKKVITPFNFLSELVSAPNVTIKQDVDFANSNKLFLEGLVKRQIPLFPLKDSYEAAVGYLKTVGEAKALKFEFAPYNDIAIALTVAICSRHRIQTVNNLMEITPLIGSTPCTSAVWGRTVDAVAKTISGKEPIGALPSKFDRVSVMPTIYMLVVRHGRVENLAVAYHDMQTQCKAAWQTAKGNYDSVTADIDYGNKIIANAFSQEDFNIMKNKFNQSAAYWGTRQFLKDYADNQFLGKPLPHIGASYWGSIQMLYTVGCAFGDSPKNPMLGARREDLHVYVEGNALKRRIALLHHVLGIRGASLYVDDKTQTHLAGYTYDGHDVPQLAHMDVKKFRTTTIPGAAYMEVWESYETVKVDYTIIQGDPKDKDQVNAILTVAKDHASTARFATHETLLLLAHNTFTPAKIPSVITKLNGFGYSFRIIRHPQPANDRFYWALLPKRLYSTTITELHRLLYTLREAPMFDVLRRMVVANGYLTPVKGIYFEEKYFMPAWLFTMQWKLKNKSVKAGLIVETSAESVKFSSTFLVSEELRASVAAQRGGMAAPLHMPAVDLDANRNAPPPGFVPPSQLAAQATAVVTRSPTSPPPPAQMESDEEEEALAEPDRKKTKAKKSKRRK